MPYPFTTTRRRLLVAASIAATGLVGLQNPAFAQAGFPTRPLKLIVPFPPGGGTDTSARLIADKMSVTLGQTVVVENRPGAGGNIGAEMVAKSSPDGYTLLLGYDGTLVINPHVFPQIPFDTLKDFAPVAKIGESISLLVAHPGVAAKSLQELIALSKRTGGMSYGTPGNGSTPHIATELLNQRTGSKFRHVPYKGSTPAVMDVLGGHIPLAFTSVAAVQQYVDAGKLRAVAVPSTRRAESMPNVPTFIESGVTDVELNGWVGILAPSGTPRMVVERLNSAINQALALPEVRARLNGVGMSARPGTPEAFSQEIRRDYAAYGPIVKAAGITNQ